MNAYFESINSIERARLGYHFTNGSLSESDAYAVIRECQEIACFYPLEGISVGGVLEAAPYRWSSPESHVEPYVRRACERVYDKWSSTGDITGAAEEWALNLIAEYAAEDGVELVEGEREEELA